MIKIDNLNIEFNEPLIINGSLILPKGSVTGIVGSSGSGKTALLEVLGLFNNNPCNYYFDDININELTDIEKNSILREDISFIFQDIHLFEDFTLKENITFYASLVNKTISNEEIYNLLNDMNLDLSLDSDVKTMSIGERQRLSIICGLVKGASLFILDEPSAYLDSANKENIINILHKLSSMSKTVVVASHDDELIKSFDRIYKIENKKLILIKDREYLEDKGKHENSTISLNILKSFINLKRIKHNLINIILGVFIGLVLGCTIFSFTYSGEYNKLFNNDLLKLLNYKLVISKNGQQPISPKEYSEVESNISDKVYPYLEVDALCLFGNNNNKNIIVAPYYSFEKMDNNIINNNNSKYYISYELSRIVNSNFKIKINNYDFNIKNTNILKSSYTNNYVIYIEYNEYLKILEKANIDIYNTNINGIVVELDDIKNLTVIDKQMIKGFALSFPEELGLDSKLTINNIFNPKIMLILDVIVVVSYIVYSIYKLYYNHLEIALLKSLGLSKDNLLKMKLYDMIKDFKYIFIISLIINIILMIITNIFSLLSILLIILHIIIISIILYISYYIFINKYTVSSLLRKM